ncbi:MAG: LPS export ABC transporter permease LptG [Steroidobacteraceae bacterium]
MGLLDRYIARAYWVGILPVVLLLGGLFSFLGLAEQLEDVGKGDFTTGAAIRVVLLMMPRQIVGILPVVALLGALTGLGALANSREIIAARAVGRSPADITRPAIMVALMIVLAAFLMQTFGIPVWERKALLLRDQIQQTQVGKSDHAFWTRAGRWLLRVDTVEMGRVPAGIEIYELDARHRLVKLIRAKRADIVSVQQWVLHDVTELDVQDRQSRTTVLPTRVWDTQLSPAQLESLAQPTSTLAPIELYRYIRSLEKNRLNTHELRLAFWQLVSIPFGIVAMALLAVPFMLGSPRHTPVAQRIAVGGAIGILFYLADQITLQLGSLYDLNPLLAGTMPELALMIVATWRISRVW